MGFFSSSSLATLIAPPLSHPEDPCMVYLPTFPIKINQMQVNIPYMDPMGQGSFSVLHISAGESPSNFPSSTPTKRQVGRLFGHGT